MLLNLDLNLNLNLKQVQLIAVVCLLAACGDRVVPEDQRDEVDSSAFPADLRPDFSGVWSNASITRLTRAEDVKNLVLTPEQAQQLLGHASRYDPLGGLAEV